jgi:hypothetical protein
MSQSLNLEPKRRFVAKIDHTWFKNRTRKFSISRKLPNKLKTSGASSSNLNITSIGRIWIGIRSFCMHLYETLKARYFVSCSVTYLRKKLPNEITEKGCYK